MWGQHADHGERAHEGERLLPLPRLQPLRRHKWGTLRVWPKWKTLKEVWRVCEKLESRGVRGEEDGNEEKEKCENLLYELLPPSVADKLIHKV